MINTNQGVENNNYIKEKLLGEGAFGKAYLVRYLTDNSLWVMKQMDISAMSPKEKQETYKEAKILEILDHPNIVKFKDVFIQGKSGKLCIIMEYADGGDLAQKIKDQKGQPIPETKILDWFTQICLAIKHVHDRKIIHRDLKGLNIFLTKSGNIKLGDFGIARIFERTMDKAKTQIGTPYYLSPEIIESRPYSFASDIWSLGAILYELCVLKPPFLADNLPNLAIKISKGQYPPIQSKTYSNDLKSLVDKLLQVNPSKRPTINQILKFPVIVNRIKQFLTESVKQVEFAHTMIHKQQLKMDLNINNVKRVAEEGIQKPPNLQARSQPQSISEPPVIQKVNSIPPQPQPQQQMQQPKQQVQQPPQQVRAPQQQQMKPQIIQPNKPTPILWNKNPQIQQQQQPQQPQKSAPNQFNKQNPTPQQTPVIKGGMQRQQSGNKIQRSNSKNKLEEVKRQEQEKEREKLEKQRQLRMQEEAKKKQEQQKREMLKQQQIEQQNQQREENRRKRELERQQMREDIKKKIGQKSIVVEDVAAIKKNQVEENLQEYNSDEEQQNDQLNESFENHLKTESTQPNNDYGVQCEEVDKDNLEMAKIIIQIEQLAQDEEEYQQRESDLEEFEQKRQQLLEQEDDINDVNDYGDDFDDDDDQLVYSNTEDIKGIEQIVIKKQLEDLIGQFQVENASQILKNELKIKSIDDIEKEHGPSSFATLFPFIEKSIRKKAVPLLFQYQQMLMIRGR